MRGKGAQFSGRRMTAGGAKSPNNVTSTFFNTVHFLPKDLRFEHGDTKLVSFPGRPNLVTPLVLLQKIT